MNLQVLGPFKIHSNDGEDIFYNLIAKESGIYVYAVPYCPVYYENGYIYGWQGTKWDRSGEDEQSTGCPAAVRLFPLNNEIASSENLLAMML